jgi:hypothetical protein
MTDEKIKPVAYRWRNTNGPWIIESRREHIPERFAKEIEPLYPESALAQAEEKGRQAGMREAAEIVLNGRFLHDEAPTKIFANEAAAAITRASEGK